MDTGLEIGAGLAHSIALMRHLVQKTHGWWWPPQ
jgi:hypothetical protein